MNVCNMIEMRSRGFLYIWFNGYVSSKIDRVLCNNVWVIKYNFFIVEFGECGFFDYVFIILDF